MTLARVKTWIAGEVLTASDLNTEFDHCDNNLAVSSELAASSGSALIGFLQAGTGAVARTVQSKERDIVNVKDFGAVGDGVTDDTAAIVLAHNAAKTIGGSTSYARVNFPAGSYKFTQLTWSPHVEAHALGDVILTTALASGNAITVTNSAGNANTNYRNKVFSGNFFLSNTNTSNSAIGVYVGDTPPSTTYTAAFCVFETLAVSGFYQSHQYGNNAYLADWINCYFSPGSVAGSSSFLRQGAALTNSGENLNYINCVVTGFAQAIDLTTANIELNFIGGSFDYNATILTNNPSNSILRFHSVHFEWNNTANIPLQINGSAVSVIDPYFIYTGGAVSAAAMIASIGGTNGSLTVTNPTYNIAIDLYYYYVSSATAVLKYSKKSRQFGTDPTNLVTNPGAGTTSLLVETADMPQLLTAVGYAKLPPDPVTGKQTIYQWGTVPNTAIGSNASVTSTVTFPIAFPTAVFHAGMSTQPDASADFYGVTQRILTGTPLTTTQFAVKNGATAQNFINNTWFAIGC